jgi:hypothetical protein
MCSKVFYLFWIACSSFISVEIFFTCTLLHTNRKNLLRNPLQKTQAAVFTLKTLTESRQFWKTFRKSRTMCTVHLHELFLASNEIWRWDGPRRMWWENDCTNVCMYDLSFIMHGYWAIMTTTKNTFLAKSTIYFEWRKGGACGLSSNMHTKCYIKISILCRTPPFSIFWRLSEYFFRNRPR